MIVEAKDTKTGETHYFQVNFAPKYGMPYVFMWLDGQRRVLEMSPVSEPPPGITPARATFDVPSHEIIVQTGR